MTTFFFLFLSPQLILQKSNGKILKKTIIFQGSGGGSNFLPEGSNFFQGGGGGV